MAQASYSFIDVAALTEVRERFAAGDALVILSGDLEEVIWANGPGAALFGHADVEAILGVEAPLGAAAKRQIAATSGFPDIGRDRALIVRIATGMSSQALPLLASVVALPDGERAILLAQPAAGVEGTAERAIGGFAAAGHFLAFVDAEGAVEAASPGFARLGLTQDALAGMAREATSHRPVIKRRLTGRRGTLPAGLARLTDAKRLLVVIDDGYAEEDATDHDDTVDAQGNATAVEPAVEQADVAGVASDPAREIWYLGSEDAAQAAQPEALVPVVEEAGQAECDEPQQAIEQTVVEAQDEAGDEAVAHQTEEETAAVSTGPETFGEQASEISPPSEPTVAPQESPPRESAPAQRAGPVRFVWRTDAGGKFSQVSPEFALAVGELAADVVGRRFQDVANAFGLDPTGDIAGLLARRDTWSGRTVSWPVAGTDLKMPVDLAALPVYDRNRNFEGFRGFGVARTGDASVDPEGIGLVLVRLPEPAEAEEQQQAGAPDAEGSASANAELAGDVSTDTTANEAPASETPVSETPVSETPDDPFRGEKPALSVAPAPNRRFSDKVIRLAEHRSPANDQGQNGNSGASERSLSTGERIAFQQIGERLKKESGTAADAGKAKEAGSKPARDKETERPAAGKPESVAMELPGQAAIEEPDETAADAEGVADLQALDGVAGSEAPAAEADEGPTLASDAPVGSDAVTETVQAVEAPEEPEPEPPARARKTARPGMSLLDFAQWGSDEPSNAAAAEAAAEPKAAAQVEMEEAAALDERAPSVLHEESESTSQPALKLRPPRPARRRWSRRSLSRRSLGRNPGRRNSLRRKPVRTFPIQAPPKRPSINRTCRSSKSCRCRCSSIQATRCTTPTTNSSH